MALRPITQNPERYTQKESDWQVQAEPQIIPLILKAGASIPVKPLIKAPGIVVKVGEHYLISEQTLKDIQDSKNPHFDINETGEVKVNTQIRDEDTEEVISTSVVTVKTGRTVPIIEVKTEGLIQKISEQDKLVPFAGVSGVDFLTETELVDGVPKGLIQQIDYTLTEEGQRPADRFLISDLNLDADYSIDQLKVDTAQEDGTLNQDKLKTFLTEINNRLRVLREDFNNIKRIHYLGEQPTGSTLTTTEYIQVASAEESGSTDGEQLVIKEAKIIDIQPTPQTGGNQTSGSSGTTPTVPGTPDTPAQQQKREWLVDFNPQTNTANGKMSIFKEDKITQWFQKPPKGLEKVKDLTIGQSFTGKKIRDMEGLGGKTVSVWEVYDYVDKERIIGYGYADEAIAVSIKAKG